MSTNYLKYETLKLSFSFIILSIFLLNINSSPIINYDSCLFSSANETGLIDFKDNNNELLKLKLAKVKFFGVDQDGEISDYSYNTTKNMWNITQTNLPNKLISISMSHKTITINLSINNGTFVINLKNSQKRDDDKFKFKKELIYAYTFNYTSLLPFAYSMYKNEKESTFITSGINNLIFSVDENKVKFEKNSFTIEQKEFTFRYVIPHPKENKLNELKKDKYLFQVNKLGGETFISEKDNPYWPKVIKIQTLGDYNLNEKNQVEKNNFKFINNQESAMIPYFTDKENNITFLTHVWKKQEKKLTKHIYQRFIVFKKNLKIKKFTNQDRIINKTAYYNLNSYFYINKRNLILNYKFDNYTLPEKVEKGYGNSKYFEITFNIRFDGEHYIRFNLFANLATTDKNDDFKIISIKANNKEDGIFNTEEDYFIVVRTTPFKNCGEIQLLFEFYENSRNASIIIFIGIFIAVIFICMIVLFFIKKGVIRKKSDLALPLNEEKKGSDLARPLNEEKKGSDLAHPLIEEKNESDFAHKLNGEKMESYLAGSWAGEKKESDLAGSLNQENNAESKNWVWEENQKN